MNSNESLILPKPNTGAGREERRPPVPLPAASALEGKVWRNRLPEGLQKAVHAL